MEHGPFSTIGVTVEDGVATITMQRPEKYNAMNDDVMLDLCRVFDEITLDRSIDVVVITGEGEDAFSAGADIEQYAGAAEEHDPLQKDRQDLFYDMYRKPLHCHCPVIAKINGYCVGGGLILAMYCDIRVAVEDAQFAVPVTDIGQIPTGGSNRRAVELVGEAKAKELVFTAGYIDAEEAADIGLINHAVPDGELEATVEDLVTGIRDTGRMAVKNSKRAINQAVKATSVADDRPDEAELWWEQFATDERRRLVAEFNE